MRADYLKKRYNKDINAVSRLKRGFRFKMEALLSVLASIVFIGLDCRAYNLFTVAKGIKGAKKFRTGLQDGNAENPFAAS